MPLKVGVLTTHPIQYQVPWFRLLAQEPTIDLRVFYCLLPTAAQQGDGFGVAFEWDIPLLDGYQYQVLTNVAQTPSVTSFNGCDTPEIFAMVKGQPWDAFIVNGWVAKSCLQLLLSCRLHQVPCIVRGESNNLSLRPGWKRQLQRLLIGQYSAYLPIGSANRQFYLDAGVRSEKLFFTPYCIENKRFADQADNLRGQKLALREKFHLDPHGITFLYCAKFVDKKRPLDLLQAIAELKEQGKATGQVLMVGDGTLRPACEVLVKEHNLPVQFTGFLNQAEIVAAYVAADCLVLPSDAGETWGLVVNEAMACGLPAIVSNQVGCHADLIVPERTGWTYPLGEITQLGDRLTTAINLGSPGLTAWAKTPSKKLWQSITIKRLWLVLAKPSTSSAANMYF
ncbi:glycosyltransferase family 4 protein [Synechocystis salina LEGE 06099]|uniref:glycosyltransferase family 4 protein n=1 Tax=Synechocystis salina TaxID=945780 RepID=UPI001880D2AB|nr:glycosyltransferase family 4 protein [Synechocystis salina]MBE9203843.1 glycosyltransferase family 4 protein [Synechocystis salina LEGE 06099]